MIGLFELGNSTIKFAIADENELQIQNVERWHYRNHLNELASYLTKKMAKLPRIEHVWISSVAEKNIGEILRQVLNKNGVERISVIETCSQLLGLSNCYSEPKRLGVDRWLKLIAVWRQYKSAAIIIDVGTALTIDVLADDGKHLGGYISPGLGLMRESLLSRTNFEFDHEKSSNICNINALKELACDTESAVLRGTLYSIVSWIDRIVASIEMSPRLSKNNSLIQVITGGDAQSVLPLLEKEKPQQQYKLETNLTLIGMLTVAMSEL